MVRKNRTILLLSLSVLSFAAFLYGCTNAFVNESAGPDFVDNNRQAKISISAVPAEPAIGDIEDYAPSKAIDIPVIAVAKPEVRVAVINPVKPAERVKEKCLTGEVLTQMRNGTEVCCPVAEKVCYPTLDDKKPLGRPVPAVVTTKPKVQVPVLPADAKCLGGETLTKMKSGEDACCPKGGKECYPVMD